MTRLQREQRTVQAMIRLHCRDRHGSRDVCDDCEALLAYAMKRLEACRFGEGKPTCSNCPIHCYKPDMREKITAVMRYAGPRMLRHHPVMAVRHLWDNFRRSHSADEPR